MKGQSAGLASFLPRGGEFEHRLRKLLKFRRYYLTHLSIFLRVTF